MGKIVSNPGPGSAVGFLKGEPVIVSPEYQNYFEDGDQEVNRVLLGQALIMDPYTVATLPSAATLLNGSIIVTDETGGRTIATSNGVNWLRVSDGNIVS